MVISADKLERIVFVKYLLHQAERTKELERPLSSAAILILHDAIECFLQLVFEQLTGKSKISGQNILEVYTQNTLTAKVKIPSQVRP